MLAPGESVTRIADIGAYYDLSTSGEYSIQYNVLETQLMRQASNVGLRGRLSPELEFNVGPEYVTSNEVKHPIGGPQNSFLEKALSTRQTRRWNAAPASPASHLRGAAAPLNRRRFWMPSAFQHIANGAASYLNGTPSATQRFTWFGTYSSANWNQIKDHFTNIKDAFDNKPVTVDCSCKKTYYAFVYPNQPTRFMCARRFGRHR